MRCASARSEILGGGELDVAASRPRTVATVMPGPFGERRIVGEIVAACLRGAAMRLEQRRESEGLRRLHRAQAARGRRVPATRPLGIDALERVGDRSAGIAAPVVAAGGDRARDQVRPSRTAAPRRGPARCPGARGASASRPARTEACRVAPPDTGGSSSQPCGGRGVERAVVGMDDRLHRADLGHARRTARRLRADHRLARQSAGIAWADRRRPAARGRLRRPRRRPKAPFDSVRRFDDRPSL